ncbi:hypothetical protein [Candidatus Poriferisodalis sp.]|uniref:hypothetical protein n=1 Tax=Candidatus Poriferisodalis sp. TaxID=3101277 RepID=UPI003B515504
MRTASFDEIVPLTQFLYRVIAVHGTDRSNPSAEASTDSERQLPAAGLVTVTDKWRTGATVRVNMTGTDADSNQLSDADTATPPTNRRRTPGNRRLARR